MFFVTALFRSRKGGTVRGVVELLRPCSCVVAPVLVTGWESGMLQRGAAWLSVYFAVFSSLLARGCIVGFPLLRALTQSLHVAYRTQLVPHQVPCIKVPFCFLVFFFEILFFGRPFLCNTGTSSAELRSKDALWVVKPADRLCSMICWPGKEGHVRRGRNGEPEASKGVHNPQPCGT